MMMLGTSLKMYFGYEQTLHWTRRIAELVRARRTAAEIFLLPTFPAIPAVAEILSDTPIAVGAQDLAAGDDGAQTGEVGGAELAELGCRYVEVGHAERRRLFGESEETVAAKTATALRHGLTPVLCLGEAEQGSVDEATAACLRQLESALAHAWAAGLDGRLVLAYEPHWAIGAPKPAPVGHIAGVCATLRSAVGQETRHPDSAVIYGGSAGPGLLTDLAGAVDGLFLGRFAHDPVAFAAVLDEAAAQHR